MSIAWACACSPRADALPDHGYHAKPDGGAGQVFKLDQVICHGKSAIEAVPKDDTRLCTRIFPTETCCFPFQPDANAAGCCGSSGDETRGAGAYPRGSNDRDCAIASMMIPAVARETTVGIPTPATPSGGHIHIGISTTLIAFMHWGCSSTLSNSPWNDTAPRRHRISRGTGRKPQREEIGLRVAHHIRLDASEDQGERGGCPPALRS